MQEKDTKDPWWKPGVVMFTKVSVSIAIPIIVALYLGKYLDAKYGTMPWIFLGLTAVAFIISLVSIWHSLSRYLKNLEIEEKNKNEHRK